jgi:hypothetical protein
VSAEEIMALIRESRLERREDLQGVMDSHIGATATSILLLGQARLQARLFGADPNTEVIKPGESQDSATPQESS